MIVRAVHLLWNGLRLVPGARAVGGAFLQTGSGRAFARWMMRPLSASSAWQEESLADLGSPLHSSTYGLRRPYPPPQPEHYAQVETAYAERRGTDPARVAFVSANMGNYESPIHHEHLLDDADYVLVSDTWPTLEGPTRVVPADYFDSDPVRMARFVKTHPSSLRAGRAGGRLDRQQCRHPRRPGSAAAGVRRFGQAGRRNSASGADEPRRRVARVHQAAKGRRDSHP
jgi:hypothetical protein